VSFEMETPPELKLQSTFAVFDEKGTRLTDWQAPDEDGGLTFDFPKSVTEFTIQMQLPDGTIMEGEHTAIEEIS
jgi:hypothetical protein